MLAERSKLCCWHAAPWKVTLHGGQGWQCEGPDDPIGVESWRYCQMPSLHGSNKGQFTYAIASSYSWGEVMQVICECLLKHACSLPGDGGEGAHLVWAGQAVDLQAQLQKRGMTAQEAAGFLDNSPDITFSVWCVLRSILQSSKFSGASMPPPPLLLLPQLASGCTR